MRYLYRIADRILLERLDAFGAVLIEGPKWCGKTTTAEQVAKSVIRLQDTDMKNILQQLHQNPHCFYKGRYLDYLMNGKMYLCYGMPCGRWLTREICRDSLF